MNYGYDYGNSYDNGLGDMFNFFNMFKFWGNSEFINILSILALFAFVALCIVGYIMFLGKGSNINRKNAWGRFFNFDHLYLNGVIKVLFLVLSVFNLVNAICMPLIAASAGGFIAFFTSLFIAVILFFIIELLLRLGFEYTLLFIRMSNDLRYMRRASVADEIAYDEKAQSSLFNALLHERPVFPQSAAPRQAAPAAQYAPVSGRVAPFDNDAQSDMSPYDRRNYTNSAPARESQTSTTKPTELDVAMPGSTAPEDDATRVVDTEPGAETWVCEQCGNPEAFGNFCGKCGSPRK